MAAQEVLNALNQIYDLGDSLDDAGIGTLTLTNGNKTTRESCRLDIAHFLVYVGNGGSFVTDAQASLLGIVLGSQYGQVTPEAFRNVAKDVGVPEADKSLSILTFCHCDQVLSRKNGTKSTSLTDVLVNLYESVGQLMVALNENVISRSRYEGYIREMKSVIASHLADEEDSHKATLTFKPTEQSESIESKRKTASGEKPKRKKNNKPGEYSDVVRFDLPADFEMIWKEKDDGSNECQIISGESTDENGNTVYRFNCAVTDNEITDTDDDVIPSGEKALDTMHRRDPDRQLLRVSDNPEAELHLMKAPLNILGSIIKAYSLVLCIPVAMHSMVTALSIKYYDEGHPEDFRQHCVDMLAVMKAVRVNGKPLKLGRLTAAQITKALTPDFDNEGGTAKIKAGIGLQIRSGDSVYSSGTMIGNDEGGVDYIEKYKDVDPSDELYQHYGKLKREHEKWSGIGIIHVQSNGAEFQPISVMEHMKRNGMTGEPLFKTLSAEEAKDKYTLDDTALRLAQVFRVDKDSFNSRHDAEGEIREHLMDKKWKLSALRSFAWTLADMADREGKSIDDYDYEALEELCGYIKGRDWLNYEDGSWFDGLCGQPDLHVFYVPDAVIQAGQSEDLHRVMCYAPVFSLDALRSDLEQLENVMKRLYNGLLVGRDRSQYLESSAAAVLYAWCVMTVSAKEAFFSEDGPMVFFHGYPSDSLNSAKVTVGRGKAKPKKAVPKPKKVEPAAVMESAARNEIVKGPDGKERVQFGEYPQGEPITWLVMEDKGGCLTLLSEFGLDAQPFFDSRYGGGFSVDSTNQWEESTLRKWLNKEFYNAAFSTSERAMIQLTELENYNKDNGNDVPCASTEDRVYLLSAKELRAFFPKDQDRICKATAYARERGAEIEAGPNQCHWWLRCPAVGAMGMGMWAPRVGADSTAQGWGIFTGDVCVRPVIRVKRSDLSGLGKATPKKTSRTASKTPAARKPASQASDAANKVPAVKKSAAKKPAANRELETITIPEGTTVIEKKAYKGKKEMERVVIPEGVTEIQEEAFKDCSSLREVVFSKSLTAIGKDAFHRCKKLESIVLPDSVTQIGEGAFNGCEGMKSAVLSKGMMKLEKKTFYNCKKLETVEIPDSVTDIGAEAFRNCEKLERITIPDGVKKIGADAFCCTGLTEVELPEGVQLEQSVFFGCKRLSELSIPKGMTVIPEYLCKSCENLEEVIIPDIVTTIGESAFDGCHRLAEIDLPENVTEIGEDAFSGCGFSRITIPGGVQKIAGNAFSKCARLESISIPDGVDSISNFAFSHCESLKSVEFPKSLRSIGEWAFSYCSKLVRIDLKEGLETIGGYAFHECAGITQAIIPDSVTKIGESAFQKCSALSRVKLSNKLVSIGNFVFLDCEKLTSIRLPASVRDVGCGIGSYTMTDVTIEGHRSFEERFKLQQAFSSPIKWVDMPNEPFQGSIRDFEPGDVLDLHGARIVEESRFEGLKYEELNGLIPSGVLILPEGLTEIRQKAFKDCFNLYAVVFPRTLRVIGENAFEGCSNLQIVEFQEGLETIESRAFYDRNMLTDVYLPDSLKVMWKDAFDDGFAKLGRHITLHLSGTLAKRLSLKSDNSFFEELDTIKAFVIDGVSYEHLEDYRAKLAKEERAKQEQARREREAAERQAAEERKKAERERINAQIYDLSQEMDSLKGLFAGMKRKKLQKQIDELNEQLRRL